MDNKQFTNIIETLASLNDQLPNSPASFDLYFFEPGEDEDSTYILANNKGVLNFAITLLKGLNESLENIDTKYIRIETPDLSTDGDIPIKHIDIYTKKVTREDNNYPIENNWTDNLWIYGCLFILFFIIICFIWGFVGFVKFIFSSLF